MQKSLSTYSSQPYSIDQVLTISRSVYNALYPVDRVMAQALEKIGKVRIVDEDD
jgi:hypothetical protein